MSSSPMPIAPGNRGIGRLLAMMPDQISLTTWIFFGAAVQTLLTLLPIKNALKLTPMLAYFVIKSSDILLMLCGVKKNHYAADVIKGKMAISFEGDDQSDGGLCVFNIGIRCTQLVRYTLFIGCRLRSTS